MAFFVSQIPDSTLTDLLTVEEIPENPFKQRGWSDGYRRKDQSTERFTWQPLRLD
jgi:hypothetical protein